jgi:23S rRNA-/tRNA-specific pseudouridylate synthase
VSKRSGSLIRLGVDDGEDKLRWQLPVLWDEPHLLVVDKPAGLPVLADSVSPIGPSFLGLMQDSRARRGDWFSGNVPDFLATPQRMDADVSGVLVVARTRACWQALANLFASHLAPTVTLALVEGNPQDTFNVSAPLARKPAPQGFYRVDKERGKRSETRFEVVERFRKYTLLRCRVIGGRPHQIRAHLRRHGLRLVGDELYGGRPLNLSRLKPGYRFKRDLEERPLIGRPALHVESVRLPVVVPGIPSEVVVEAPLPKDFEVALKYLRRYGALGGGSGDVQSDDSEGMGSHSVV